MKTLSKESEERILDAIQDVCGAVKDGCSPTEAVTKIAKDLQLTPNFIRLVSHGYNTGATTYQRENSDDILGKMAEFPLADADAVIAEIYPKEVALPGREKDAGAVSAEYARSPLPLTMRKAAEKQAMLKTAEDVLVKAGKSVSKAQQRFMGMVHATQKGDIEAPSAEVADAAESMSKQDATDFAETKHKGLPEHAKSSEVIEEHNAALKVKKAYATVRRQQLAIQQKRAEYTRIQDALMGQLGTLAESVKASPIWSSKDVGTAAESRFGKAGAAISHFLATRDPGVKKASAGFRAIDWAMEPFSRIPGIVKLAEQVTRLRDEYRTLVKSAQAEEAAAFAPFSATEEGSILVKEAAGFLSMLVASSIPRGIAGALATPKGNADLIHDAELELSDPDDENTRRIAAVQTMLSDFTNNDEVISGYDPTEVYGAYNEIASMAPRLSTQPAAMRALLRKRLTQGAMEPFEANELANIEKTVSEAQNPRISFGPGLDKTSQEAGVEPNVLAGHLTIG